MNTLRLLLVEDNERDLTTFRNTVRRYVDERERHIDPVVCKTLDDALRKLDNSFDGAIIDLKLDNRGDEGNLVVKKIAESFFRIPIAILAASTDNWDANLKEQIMLIGVFKKTATKYDDLLDQFWAVFDTGLTRILGGRGKIENLLSQVYLECLLPQIETWISYGKDNSKRTEDALLRYTLNHLLQLLEEGEEGCFPEEVYLHSPLLKDITTGSIVKDKTNHKQFVVMSPACDLVLRGQNGKSNTDYILLIEIESINDALDGRRNKDQVASLVKNRRQYFHWLPPTHFLRVEFSISEG